MTNKAFKTITVLLGLSLLSFFVVQGLWISNSLRVAHGEIDRATHEAMAETGKKLELRSSLSAIRNNYVIERNDSVPGGRSKIRIIVSGKDGETMTGNVSDQHVKMLKKVPVPPRVPGVPPVADTKIIIVDSMVSVKQPGVKQVIVHNSVTAHAGAPAPDDLDSLFGKMMMEIKAFDLSPVEKMPADSVARIISAQLKQQGIDSEFEFAVVRGGTEDALLVHSAGYKQDKAEKLYSTDIFKGNILKKSDRLLLYYPSSAGLIFSRLRTLLLLSLFFGLVILCAFIFTLRLISKQKKNAEIKNDFVNNMTHELKTPIATIAVAVDALKNPKVKQDEERLEYYASVIKEENNKMNRNVEKVLQLALTEKENFNPEFSPLDLNALAEKCIANFELLFRSRSIACSFSPAGSLPLIRGDMFHLENAVNNLLDNAAKYSSGSPGIKVSTFASNGKVALAVQDNGIGMSDELKQKVFEKFYRAQTGNIHDVKGFGIGLSYVYNIMRAHKGEIQIDSIPGKGSTFTLFFNAV